MTSIDRAVSIRSNWREGLPFRFFWAAGLSLFVAVSAQASSTTATVNVLSVTPTNYGMIYFTHTTSRTQIPACGAGFSNRFAFSVANMAGQAMLSALLTAFATHKPITVFGTGTCDTAASDTESVSFFNLTD
jgi:hypothetical protein